MMDNNLYHESLEKNHVWNSLMNIIDGSFFSVAAVCFMPSIIIVSFLERYTESTFILNLPIFISNFSMAIGPFVMSFFSSRFKRKKKAMVVTSLAQRILWLPIIFVVLFSGYLGNLVIPVFLIVFTLYYIIWGLGSIFWQELIGRALIGDKMSSAMGIREFISKILSFIASIVVMYILSSIIFPHNFLILFSIAFICMMISMVSLTMIKEAPYEDSNAGTSTIKHIKNMLHLPINDKKFKQYIIFIVFSYGILFVGGLYTIIGLERFKGLMSQDRLTGMISIVTALSSAAFALVLGRTYDKIGKYAGFMIISVASTILPVLTIFCYNYYLYLTIIFFTGAINCLWFIELATIMGFGSPEKRHEYIGFISIVKLILIVIYTNVGGFLADNFSSSAALATASLFCLIGLGILHFRLREAWRG